MVFPTPRPFSLARCLWAAPLLLASACLARPGLARSDHFGGEWQAVVPQPATDFRTPRVRPDPRQPATLCDAAVRAAEFRHRLPSGLLFAISQVESGRPDAAMRRLEPWPWTVQAEGRGIYFETKAQAVEWVKEARARGVTSIDTGCLQVNLAYHPDAFETPEDAFDPQRNADYAARFLLQLHAATGDWRQATGFYHSQTLVLATSYRERIGRALTGNPLGGGALGAQALAWPAAPKPPTTLDRLGDAWRATLGGNNPAPAESAQAGPATHDWSVLLHAPTHVPPRPALPPRAQRPRSYADQTLLIPSEGRLP
jgi:hypothetical protein